jgi:hypothetical protein
MLRVARALAVAVQAAEVLPTARPLRAARAAMAVQVLTGRQAARAVAAAVPQARQALQEPGRLVRAVAVREAEALQHRMTHGSAALVALVRNGMPRTALAAAAVAVTATQQARPMAQ